MMRSAIRGVAGAILIGAVVTGCQSRSSGDVEVESTVIAPATEGEPVVAPSLPRELDEQGNLLGEDGYPVNRTFLFEFDQARLSQRDLRALALHAAHLRNRSDRQVRIEGHCDERGTREYNLALGERRAQAVQRFLASAGVRASQVQTVSYGEERPVDPASSEGAWAKNRRAELIYVGGGTGR